MKSAQLVLPATDNLPRLDKLALNAVTLLRDRNWNVPGVSVEILTHREPDGNLRRSVSSVEAGDVRIELAASGITKVHYAKRQLNIDGCSAQLFVYEGDNWMRDQRDFRKNPTLLETVTEYGDVCFCTTASRRTPNTDGAHHHDESFGSVFLSKDGQRRRVQGEFKKIAGYIRRQILDTITSVKAAGVIEDVFDRKQRPLSGVSFHLLAPREMVVALHAHKAQRRPLSGPLNGTKNQVSFVSNGHVDELVKLDHMLIGGMDDVSSLTSIARTPAASVYPAPAASHALLRVTPTFANGIYVGDLDLLEEHLSSRPRDVKPTSKRNFERSVVPIDKYDDAYQRPIVLVSREISPAEAEVIGGTWTELDNARLLMTEAPDRWRIIKDLATVWTGSEELLAPCYQYAFEQLVRELTARRRIRLITRHRFSGRRRQRTEKLLRNSLTAINEALQMGIVL